MHLHKGIILSYTWNLINELLGKQHHTNETQKLTIEGKHLTTQQDIANAFNKYFSTIIDETNSDSQENMRHGNTYCYFDHVLGILIPPPVFKTFSTQEIMSIIKSIETKNSSGYDEISTKLLNINANYICSSLTYICNKSVSTRIFPERLKFSIIKPVCKKGDKTDPSNYRAISMLTSFSKVLEKALYNRLIEFFIIIIYLSWSWATC